ncbi:metal ABC transporter solute-binding protein, Zn/Mn family [Virgibacillus senegalensis]|uniref:metal ABC transporter solute-binding protein, Zn/Mn family n=1 Tax=Virgibacillus senegalensis TaxID=1499679 RepID=UPI00069DDC7C|nr:zinc ABC transporter substrate-binding protein [Virgibacillus senegalensis]
MKKKIIYGMLFFVLLLTGCGTSSVQQEEDGQDKLTIYTTLYPLQDFTEKIGGEYVEVESILPPGADAHTFEPTSNTLVDIAESDAFIYIGAGMEQYADTIAEAVKEEDVALFEAVDGVSLLGSNHDHLREEAEDEHHEHDGEEEAAHEREEEKGQEESHHEHGDFDPHIWLDPIRSIGLAENIKNNLVELMPEHQQAFEDNFADLEERLRDLDQSFHETVENGEKPEILVSHAAFGYWEDAYGLEQIAVSGLSTSQEPSQKQLESIIEESKEHDLHYILFEQNVTPRVAEVVQKEIGAEALRIHNLSVLTEEDVENQEDYFSLMENNLETIKTAIQ